MRKHFNNMGKVKIYGTIGPACRDEDTLRHMFEEGMDGVRLNLSHTSLEETAEMIGNCRRAARACGKTPELLIDMQGPELRIGKLGAPVRLDENDLTDVCSIKLTEAADSCGNIGDPESVVNAHGIIPFPDVVMNALRESCDGQEVLLDDGKILLKTERLCGSGDIKLRVIRGGILESRKSAALPGITIPTPAMTENDREQIKRAKEFGVTAVMQPFVRSKEDLTEVRTALNEAGCGDIRLLAKIENKAGINRLSELIPECDEIVIARGDLGNSMELWELPAVQKRISAACRDAGRDFMVVTQMLDSMMHRQVPTRAEVSDIFNAVADGASSVMVTGETAAGDYPVLAIRYLYKTVREAEAFRERQSLSNY